MQASKLERDPAGRAFARLTAIFEDAVGLAAKGQSRHLSVRGRNLLAGRIGGKIAAASEILATLTADKNSRDRA